MKTLKLNISIQNELNAVMDTTNPMIMFLLNTFHSFISSVYRFEEEKAKIREFNTKNKWTKRGISIVPVKFGIAFTALHMNQVRDT